MRVRCPAIRMPRTARKTSVQVSLSEISYRGATVFRPCMAFGQSVSPAPVRRATDRQAGKGRYLAFPPVCRGLRIWTIPCRPETSAPRYSLLGLDIVSARRNRVSAPGAARPGSSIDYFRSRIDDPVWNRSSNVGSTGATRNLSRRLVYRGIRRAVAIHRETGRVNRPGFAAGTQAGEGPSTAPSNRRARQQGRHSG